MVRKGYTPEQIIGKLREAEILLNQGANIGEASRKETPFKIPGRGPDFDSSASAIMRRGLSTNYLSLYRFGLLTPEFK